MRRGVHDLLEEYAAIGGGKIVLQTVDPEPFTAAEDEATANGLSGAPTDSGDTVYFGLVGTNRIDGKEVIAYFSPDREQYLELDLTTLIYHLSQPAKPVLGIISSLPLDNRRGRHAGGDAGQRPALRDLFRARRDLCDADARSVRECHSVQRLGADGRASGQSRRRGALRHRPVRAEGRPRLVFVDPNAELAQAAGGMDPRGGGNPASDLPQLFQAWGVGYTPAKVIADRELAQRVQVSADPRNPVASYPIWLHLTQTDFDAKDPVTASLQTLNLASAGALHPLKGATTTFLPLVRSSDQASLLDVESIRFNPRPEDLMGAINPTGERFVIAARVSGPARTAFPSGPPAPLTTAGQPPPAPLPPQIKDSAGPINVIVMADADIFDIFDDRFWVHVDTL